MTDDVLFIGATGTNFTAPNGSASASAAIPHAANGSLPKYVRVSVAAGSIYFRLDKTSATALTTDTLISVSDSQIIAVSGNDKFSAYGIGAAIVGVITPLENSR